MLFSAATTAAAARSSISGFHFGGGLAALLGNHDADAVAFDLQTIGLVKCVSRVLLIEELNEAEASGLPCFIIHRKIDILYFSVFGKYFFQVVRSELGIKVSHEETGFI